MGKIVGDPARKCTPHFLESGLAACILGLGQEKGFLDVCGG
jgi:hypothetical protein